MDQQEPFLSSDVFNVNDIAEIEGKNHFTPQSKRVFITKFKTFLSHQFQIF